VVGELPVVLVSLQLKKKKKKIFIVKQQDKERITADQNRL
jgi:hypothetical protein